MTPLPKELEALMPEPAGFRMRYRSEPGMIGHYPWSYSDPRQRLFDRPKCDYEDLFTADQMREAIKAATERAAKACEERANTLSQEWRAGHKSSAHLEGQSDGAFDCAAAIRGGGREG